MKTFRVPVAFDLMVTADDIEGLLATCFEGGSTDWTYRVEQVPTEGIPDVPHHSAYVAQGGTVELYHAAYDEDPAHRKVLLTREKMLEGIKRYFAQYGYDALRDPEVGTADAIEADMMLQLAVFDEVIFG